MTPMTTTKPWTDPDSTPFTDLTTHAYHLSLMGYRAKIARMTVSTFYLITTTKEAQARAATIVGADVVPKLRLRLEWVDMFEQISGMTLRIDGAMSDSQVQIEVAPFSMMTVT